MKFLTAGLLSTGKKRCVLVVVWQNAIATSAQYVRVLVDHEQNLLSWMSIGSRCNSLLCKISARVPSVGTSYSFIPFSCRPFPLCRSIEPWRRTREERGIMHDHASSGMIWFLPLHFSLSFRSQPCRRRRRCDVKAEVTRETPPTPLPLPCYFDAQKER